MADTLDDIKGTGKALMHATGVPQVAKAASSLGQAAVDAKDYAVKKVGQAASYVKGKFASPAKRTTDIALPKEKKKLSRGRSMSKR